ncbi:ABC transporter permease subunit [Herbaspirillum lusitanum]|jgi:NitT/TauT family transport system permease protein|uniref:ABC transporter permease subunit n=1 Tax=Herbaspirillum lusitanum TaxID=213312 RepID=A0ABW9AGA3_9BURK
MADGAAASGAGRQAGGHGIESLLRILVVVVLIGAIELLCRTGVITATTMIAPSAMARHAWEILQNGKFDKDIAISLGNIGAATLLAVVLGFIVGLAVHALPTLRTALEPLLASYYAVPTFIFYPVFIVLFGVGAAPIIAIAVLLAVVTMITATLNGLDRIPASLRKTALVLRLTPWQSAVRVKLPAALPYLFTGVKLVVAYAFIGVIASEFILSGSGVGYAIGYAYNNFENDDMYALMFLVLVTVTVVNILLNALDRRLQAKLRR